MRNGRQATRLLTGLSALLLSARVVLAEPGTVEEIRILGLSHMTQQAFLHVLDIDPGDPYDLAQVRGRFRALWDLKLFEDIAFEIETAPGGGAALIIKVKERPMLSTVTYENNRVVTETQIEDRIKERKIGLGPGKPLDLGQVYFAEQAIRDLFAEKGFLDATVRAEVRRVTETSRAVHFALTPGGKTRIRGIVFQGNEVFSDRKLRSMLKLTEERRWYWPWSGKNLYHPVKWDQDVGGLREAYQGRGHLDVEIRAPAVEVRKTKKKRVGESEAETASPGSTLPEAPSAVGDLPDPAPTTGAALPIPPDADAKPLTPKERKKKEQRERKAAERRRVKEQKARAAESKRWVYLTVPVVEGPRYRLGEVTFQGNTVFSSEVLRKQVPVQDGEILDNGLVELGVNRITRLYEDRGYLYASVVRKTLRRTEGDPVADVAVEVQEDKPYYVGRIEFRGNTQTQDRVLRRELVLLEGDLFSRTRLEVSRARINRLGYFQIPEEPVIEPIEEESRIRIVLPGEEQGRNEIQVGGGFSGLEGAFFNGVYSTRNFLGRGQIVSTAIQVGGRSNRYQISFQEPWFLGHPYRFGVSLFRRETDFGASLRSTSSGGGIVLGKRIRGVSEVNLAYNYEFVTSSTFTTGTNSTDPLSLQSENEVSSITPAFAFSTINNPYRPNRGRSFQVSTQVAGGPLGGNTSFLKPVASFTAYRKAMGRSFVAVHTEAGIVREFESGSGQGATSNVKGIPRYQRFWLGGDTLGPRVFETRTITPRRYVAIEGNQIIDVVGNPFGQPAGDYVGDGVPVLIEVGGDRMYLVQSELVFPLNQQTELSLFADVGDALFEDTSLGFSTARVSAGVELRFYLPIFPVPLRLIYGVPVRKLEGDRTSNFTFSIGRSF